MVSCSTPELYAVLNPPFVPPLVFTPVLCANWPRSVVMRDGQQTESLTK